MPFRLTATIPAVVISLLVGWTSPPQGRVRPSDRPLPRSAPFSLFGYPGQEIANLEAWNLGVWVKGVQDAEWVAGVVAAQEAERERLAAEEASARRAGAAGATTSRPQATPTTWPASLSPCGGDLPPCFVKSRESGGDYNARNPTSTASGAWQFLDTTWAGYGGYPRAYLAPPEVQDAKARELWAGGRGCSHWSAC